MSDEHRTTSFCTKHQEEIIFSECDDGSVNIRMVAHYDYEQDEEIGIYVSAKQARDISKWIGKLK